MATTESAGRPPLARTASAQSTKSTKSSTSSSHSSQPKPKLSTEKQPKSQPDSPKSSKSSNDKSKESDSPPISEPKKTAPSAPVVQKKPVIDMDIFSQILELDDDDSREFSRSMVSDYYSQVDATLVKMDQALSGKKLKELSDLGHFLKGSSAALGVERVQASCERIQHAGKLRDEESGTALTEPQALDLITNMLENVKRDYPEARDELDRFVNSET